MRQGRPGAAQGPDVGLGTGRARTAGSGEVARDRPDVAPDGQGPNPLRRRLADAAGWPPDGWAG